MRTDDLDVPISFLSDALDAMEDLPRGSLSEELNSHFGNLQVRLKALVASAEIFQRRLGAAGSVRKLRAMAAPVEEADPGL
jgi:hypothetical protein